MSQNCRIPDTGQVPEPVAREFCRDLHLVMATPEDLVDFVCRRCGDPARTHARLLPWKYELDEVWCDDCARAELDMRREANQAELDWAQATLRELSRERAPTPVEVARIRGAGLGKQLGEVMVAFGWWSSRGAP